MRPLRRVLPVATLSLGVGAPSLVAPSAVAAPPLTGDRGTRLHTNPELARALARITLASRGRVDVRQIGTTNELRPLWLATVGTGPLHVLYVTEQHGDEPLGTEAAVQALRTLGLSRRRWARTLRSTITAGFVVRANPDGHERGWRYNDDPGARSQAGEPGKGYDVNRHHHPGLSPVDNPVPEAAALQRAWLAFRPSVVVDYHMQDRYRAAGGGEVTTSVLWPTVPDAPGGAVDRSKQVAVALHDIFTTKGAVVSQYPGEACEGIARNAYGLRGGASVLVELSAIPRREGFQIASAYHSMVALAVAAGAGTLGRIDPAGADTIPPRGPALPAGGGLDGELDGEDAADAA